MPHKHSHNVASDLCAPSSEIENCNHSVTWVAKAIVRSTVADAPRLLPILGCHQDEYGHVPVGGGQGITINIDKIDSVPLSV